MEARYRTVIFDCDSTLTTIEGIEALAGDQLPEVARLTELAMRGEVPLEEVYGRRLALIRPTRQAVERVGAQYVEHLVPGARPTVDRLRRAGVGVRILSGGLAPAVRVLGRALGLEPAAVAGVEIFFEPGGAYLGFDEASPLARAGGKRRWIEAADLPPPIALIGDGATDLEARPAVDTFIAFAGVVHRAGVVARADHVVTSRNLDAVISLLLA